MDNTITQSDQASSTTPDHVHVILPYEKTGEYYIEHLDKLKRKPIYEFFKRLFDIVFSLIALIVMAIPMAIIAVIVKFSSPGPVIYKQERLGKDGKPFTLCKFRTMRNDAESAGAQWSNGDKDPRIVPSLRWLRKFRFDELPQFWQCLTGKMSIVGPRPERECFYDEFEKYVHGFHERLKVKPGLTGLAQVNGGYDLEPEEKIIWDIEYIKKRSLWLDLKIIFKTIAIVFDHDGAK